MVLPLGIENSGCLYLWMQTCEVMVCIIAWLSCEIEFKCMLMFCLHIWGILSVFDAIIYHWTEYLGITQMYLEVLVHGLNPLTASHFDDHKSVVSFPSVIPLGMLSLLFTFSFILLHYTVLFFSRKPKMPEQKRTMYR